MQVSTEFLKAARDKRLNGFLVIDRPNEGKFMRLCIDAKLPYSDKTEMVFVECPTDILIDNFRSNTKQVTEVCFHTFFSRYHRSNYVETFLNSIKKTSDVGFRVVAFNQSDWADRNNVVCHKLIGQIGKKSYLLAEFHGSDNSASPVKWRTKETAVVS